jgi:PAS domain S-box-containing protein
MLPIMSVAGQGGRIGLPLSLAAVVVFALALLAVAALPALPLAGPAPLVLAGLAAAAGLIAALLGARTQRRLHTVEQELVQERDRARRAADTAQREGRDRLTVEGGREPAVLLRDLRVVAANEAAVRALDLKQVGELLGRPLADFAPADERARLQRFLVGRMAGTSAPEQFHASLVTAHGARTSVEVATAPTERDGARYELVTWRDVTGRERAEAILQAVVSHVPAAVVLCDPTGRMSWSNRQFVERTQWRSDYFFGRPLLPMVLAPDRRRAKVMLARARRGGEAEAVLRVSRRDGEVVLASVRAVPLSSPATSPVWCSSAPTSPSRCAAPSRRARRAAARRWPSWPRTSPTGSTTTSRRCSACSSSSSRRRRSASCGGRSRSGWRAPPATSSCSWWSRAPGRQRCSRCDSADWSSAGSAAPGTPCRPASTWRCAARSRTTG